MTNNTALANATNSEDDSFDKQRSEHQIAIEKFVQDSIYELYPSSKPKAKAQSSANFTNNPTGAAQVTHGVRALRSTVRRLDRVFYEVATGDKQRHLAATKISMLCRGFVVRRRYVRLRLALGNWRVRSCAGFLGQMEEFSAREEFLNAQIVQMHEARQAGWLRRVLAELRDVVLMHLPLRVRQRDESEKRYQCKLRMLQQYVFMPWKEIALGPRSRKRAAASSRDRHLAARQRLEATGRFDVITSEMVHEEFIKANVRTIRANHGRHVLRMYFKLLVTEVFEPMKRNFSVALIHARQSLLLRIWRAWLPIFRAQQVDKAIANASANGVGTTGEADGSSNRVATLRRFDKPVNLRKIDAHCRRARLKRHLRAWHKYCSLLRRVRALFESTTRSSLGFRLKRWHIRARYQRELRANTVEEWQAYCRRIFQTPFRAWYIFAAKKRARRNAQEQICVAYARRARRQTKYTFFRLWKHQTLFGNIEGVHSKLHLLHSLEDQKRLCITLEKNAALYRENIAALQTSIEQLEDKLMEKQQELAKAHADAQATRFGLHSAEQGIARVQGLVEAVRHIHPGTVARLERAFQDNPLLSADLSEVLERHAETRRQLLKRLERDETAIQVCDSSSSSAGNGVTLGGDDQLLLHRVKWVLSRLDLAAGNTSPLSNSKPNESRLTPSEDEAAGQLCSLFEFIRNGDTHSLSPENDPERDRSAKFGWPVGVNLGSNGFENGSLVVRRTDLMAKSEPWVEFVRALALEFVPDKMRSVKERLIQRAQEADDELEALKANPHIYNFYR